MTSLEDGPHEYDGDEDPDYWSKIVDDQMFVRGHQFEVQCPKCGKCHSDGLIEQLAFYFYCDCTYEREAHHGSTFEVNHNVQIQPLPVADPEEWDVWGSEGVDAEVLLEDGATIVFDHEGEQREYILESPTYFDAIKPTVATDRRSE